MINLINTQNKRIDGVAFGFKDRHIDNWYSNQQTLYNSYGFVCTVGIGNTQSTLTTNEKTKLLQMQSEGCEIAAHGTTNTGVSDYLESNTVQDYIDNEAGPSIDYLRSEGFAVTGYHFPGPVRLLPSSIYDALRDQKGVDVVNLSCGGQVNNLNNLRCFVSGRETFNYFITEEKNTSRDQEYIKRCILHAKNINRTICFGGHDIATSSASTWYQTPSNLDELCAYAVSIGLPFRTFTEAVRLIENPQKEGAYIAALYARKNGSMMLDSDWTDGSVILAGYDYNHTNNIPEKTGGIYKWYISDTGGQDEGSLISGENSPSFTLQTSQVGKYIRFGITTMSIAGEQIPEHFSAWRLILP